MLPRKNIQQPGTKYLAEPNFDFLIDLDDMSPYGLSHLSTLAGNLDIRTEMFGDDITSKPIEITIDKDIPGEAPEEIVGNEIANAEDVKVEYAGLYDYSDSSKIISTVIENNRDSEVYVVLDDTVINGYSIGLSNNGRSIPAHSKAMSVPNFQYIIDMDDLSAYGITEIESIKANLEVRTGLFGDTIYEQQVELSDEVEITTSEENATEAENSTEISTSDFVALKLGDKSDDVKKVQQALVDQGYLNGTADGAFGQMTEQAVMNFQSVKGISATGVVDEETFKLLVGEGSNSEADANALPEDMNLDETEWENWKSTDKVMLWPFMGAGEAAEFSFDLPSGQEENHKSGYFFFKDNGETTKYENVEFYYGVTNQQIIYTGLATSDVNLYNTDTFKDACVRLLLGYNIHWNKDTEESELDYTREQAENIVNYCFDNEVAKCLVGSMRIRLIRDADSNYYSFHMER